MPRIVISDSAWESHGIYIRQAVMETYNGLKGIYGGVQLTEDDFINISDFTAALAYCIENNCPALIRSYNGVQGYVELAKTVYPITQTFFPLGGTDNLHEQVSVFAEKEPPVIVTSGAGDVGFEDRNNTSYGNGLEFWDCDLALDNGGDQSSFSNGIVLGKLLFIKDYLECTWWEARFRARMTATKTEPNRSTSLWDLSNGYGFINVGAAIAYEGLIPLDPYAPDYEELYNNLLVDFGSLEASNLDLLNQLNAAYDQINVANARIAELEEFEFVRNVIGIRQDNDTPFGLSEAFKLRQISVTATRVSVTKVMMRDEDALTGKTPMSAENEILETSLVNDLVYNEYIRLNNIPEENLIADEET